MITLGKVFPDPQGEYDSTRDYEKLQVVTIKSSDETSCYIAKEDIIAETAITDPKWIHLFTVKNGAMGVKGDPGASGKSAYQYATEAGYEGTELAFTNDILNAVNTVTLDDLNSLSYVKATIVTELPANPDANTIYFVQA